MAALVLLMAASCLLSGFVAGAETAFLGLTPTQREELTRRGDARSLRVVDLLSRPRRLLLTFLIFNEAANLLLAGAGAGLLLQGLPQSWLWLNLLLVTPIILLLCEAVPKGLATREGVEYARLASGPVLGMYWAVAPVRWLLMKTSERLLAPLGIDPWSLPRQIEGHEIRHLVDLGEKEGTIAKDEADMIHSVFEFGDTVVGKLMTPRTAMVAFNVDTPLEKILEGIREQRFARVPVYEGNPDNVIGILYTKDLLSLRLVDRIGLRRTRRTLKELLRKAHFVPATKKADELFRDLQAQGVHMAIVVDEYGGVAGLITMADLLGELFGEMLDEYDQVEPLAVRQLPDGAYEVQGKVEVGTFNEVAEAQLPEDEDFATLGGFVLDRLGHLPQVGESVESDGWAFEVTAVRGRSVQALKARRLPPPPAPADQEEG